LLASILKIFSLLQTIWSGLQYIAEAWRARQLRIAEEKRQALEQALKDAEKAQTPEEAFNAQEKIVDNSNP
jgi:hypothetical protein